MSDQTQGTITAESGRGPGVGAALPPLPAAPSVNPWLFVWLGLVAAGLAFALGWRVGSDGQFDIGYRVGYRQCVSEQDDDHKPKGARP